MKQIRLPWQKTELAKDIKKGTHISIVAIAIPLIVETLLRVSLSSVDILMISSFSQEAVAAIGFVSQFGFFIMLLHNVVAIGTSIVIAQYVGAKRFAEAKEVSRASILMVVIVGALFSFIFAFATKPVLQLYTLEPLVRQYAFEYFIIFSSCSIFSAISTVQSAILRSYGYTKDTMIVNVISNIINIAGNAIALYGFFGLPVFGVAGVAFSTVFSQFFGFILLTVRINRIEEIRFSLKKLWMVNIEFFKRILKIGIPTAGENISYNISQIVIMSIITLFGTYTMSAFTYMMTIMRFIFGISSSIGTAVQIKTGYYVGANQRDVIYKKLYIYQLVGTLISMASVTLVIIFKSPITTLFTQTVQIKDIMFSLMPILFILEMGRSINLITIPALKGAGDIQYPVFVGIISMWLLSVLGGYILAIPLQLGIIGIFIMMAADEGIRGIIFLLRWKSKRWMLKDIL